MEFLTRLMPTEVAGPALLAGLGWMALNYFVLAPEVAKRLAVLEYIPACEAGIAAQDAAKQADYDDVVGRIMRKHEARLAEARQRAQAEYEAQLRRRALGGVILDIVDPDGVFRDLAGTTISKNRMPGIAQPELPPSPEIMSDLDRASACANAATAVVSENAFDWAIFSATATWYAPDSVRNVNVLIAKKVGAEHG